jgi:sulfoxide reductase heme-binding subunit YedZ
MPTRGVPYVKMLVHLFCLWPVAWLLEQYRSGALAAQADPINFITHATGDWALWLLLASLAVTPLRRLHARLSNLIRFRRLLGLYAFFYASLHLATYIFLFSGYDITAAWEGARHGHLAALWTQWVQIWPTVLADIEKRRFIQVGFSAWLILLALALTSPTFVLRRMGGKNWQRLHRLVYVAAAAACIHYWWLVKAGVRRPLPDTLVLTALLLARVAWELIKRRRSPGSRAGTQAAAAPRNATNAAR